MTQIDPTQPPQPPAPVPSPPAPAAKTFTQDEVNALDASTREQARRQATREITERLGCTVEEAEQMLKDARDADTARLSEVERKEKEAENAKQKAEEDSAKAQKVLRDSKIRDELLDAGVKRERLAVAARSVDVPEGADDSGIKAAVATYKGEVPEFFDASTDPPTDPPKPGDPPVPSPPSSPAPRTRPTGKPDESSYDRGVERAKKMGGIPDAAASAGGQGS